MPSFFRITLMRSAIGLPAKTSGVLRALGLHKRMRTVYHPVSPQIAGQIFAVKELVDVQEVDQALTKTEIKELRKPDPGFFVETRARDARAKLVRDMKAEEGRRRLSELSLNDTGVQEDNGARV